jgi:hypothetical protein
MISTGNIQLTRIYMVIPEPTARSADSSVSPGEGTNSARLFTPGERKALAKCEVHQTSRAYGYDPRVDLKKTTDLKKIADCYRNGEH